MSIESFIKIGDTFEHVTPAHRPHVDEYYVDGAIVWKVGSKVILGTEHWDLVDQLWAYIINGMLAVVEHGEFKCTFPDQPLLLKFVAIRNRKIEVTIGDDVTVVDRHVFFTSLIDGARSFFKSMCDLLPELHKMWELQLSRLDKIVWSQQ